MFNKGQGSTYREASLLPNTKEFLSMLLHSGTFAFSLHIISWFSTFHTHSIHTCARWERLGAEHHNTPLAQ